VSVGNENDRSYDLTTYKEVILQVTDVMLYEEDAHPEWTHDRGTPTDRGIPDNIEDGRIMATITNFNIKLKDTDREAFEGNMPDFNFGIQEDGMSVDYRQAVWNLSSDNLADAKKTGAAFEFVTKDVDIRGDTADGISATIGFAWQDPDRGLWWQDAVNIAGWNNAGDYYEIIEGVDWNSDQHKIRIDLATIIKDSRFASASNVNFIIALWWQVDFWKYPDNPFITTNIDDLNISGANVITPPSSVTGNMGNWYYGYKENGVTLDLQQAVWYNLASDVLDTAKEPGAALELGFNKDIIGPGNENPHLYLIWQNPDTNRWWAAEGVDYMEYTLGNWQGGAEGSWVPHNGVSYDSGTKKLTVVLEDALEGYNTFINTTGQINFLVTYGYPPEANVNSLGIVSANIVPGAGGSSGFGAQLDGSYTLDPTSWNNWYGASATGNVVSFTNGGMYMLFPAGFDITQYTKLEIKWTAVITDATGSKSDGAALTVKIVTDQFDPILGSGSDYGTDIGFPNITKYNHTTWTYDDTPAESPPNRFTGASATDWVGIAVQVNSADTDDKFTVTVESITFK